MKHSIPTALSIAGTDPTGGAGIQADLKTFQEREVFGMSVITSVVAQNTLGVKSVEHLPIPFISDQLNCVMSDIVPDVIKTGMIATSEMMELIAKVIKNHSIPYVIDPVMVAKSGDHLMDANAKQTLVDKLIRLAAIVTPNIPEAEVLLQTKINSVEDSENAARQIVTELGAKAAVVKGGHFSEVPIDVLYDGNSLHEFSSIRYATKHTHGTGCTYSAVIAAELAKGHSIQESVSIAKKFITDAIQFSLQLGKGNGPTNHWGHRLQGLPEYERGDVTDELSCKN
ncbi:bifunctional hydroxymethylpyrimidine kinase/phosphomethylpyrimidine kinase [Virgibacillus oceani]|uniref:Hydroxymethylpyrimidine/phosphomethylpyrimidine kinase n=1 Tax=Virgibacillus oceani TaxID=1479511 RepID=A0A917HBW6_9BACI|nr:bifunctional hydroxymethylpyrimidine kinase/phosphomethylpyrimidine kinase [Virgibacillus oceani]GGG74629.1 hydroxymethylpyrimidine/phosphomethylpyrimidine kinase [Virgibacillus oceani]